MNPSPEFISTLLPALKWLDNRLVHAVSVASYAYGPEAINDPFRGLHLGTADVERMLTQQPGAPLPWNDDEDTAGFNPVMTNSRLIGLSQLFGLGTFDLAVILIALAPEIDLRYERIYAYLQDDVTRRWPSIELALNLLCSTFEEKIARRAAFTSQGPLIRNDILHLVSDPHQTDPPFLSKYLRLDDQIVQFLLGSPGLDQRLEGCCELIQPTIDLGELPFRQELKDSFLALLRLSQQNNEPLALYCQGSEGSGRRRLAQALAAVIKRSLLTANLRQTSLSLPGFENTLRLIFRQAWILDAVLYLEGMDEILQVDQETLFRVFSKILAKEGRLTLMAGELPWKHEPEPICVIQTPFDLPDSGESQAWWSTFLSKASVRLNDASLVALASRFRLTPGQIEAAVTDALGRATWRGTSDKRKSRKRLNKDPKLTELFAAARAQTSRQLSHLAQKIQPRYTWEDIILPEDSLAQLHELAQWVVQRNLVLENWGFERCLSLGKAATALFAGPSGAGKTMAAEIIANELGLDLYRIDLSTVVSKYIGETEKNLERIFSAAENANAILFFDEADALFGKRSEVRDAHDRYANIEISYLLQKIEQYEGVAILASNLRQNMDEAFTRRLAFIIPFPFPDAEHRQLIWQGVFPAKIPLADDLDLSYMAQQFKLSGGNIKNVALSAAFLAASDGGVVTQEHLFHATQREYQKMGKTFPSIERVEAG